MNADVDFAVRPAHASDLPAVLTLVGCCEDAPQWSEAVWRQFAAAGAVGRLLLLAQGDDGGLCGLLAATFVAGQAELESVLVAPAARRRGLGRRLTLAWLAWAKAAGATVAMLELRASNGAALALYHALGFVLEGRRPFYYQHPAEDAILMGQQVRPDTAGRAGELEQGGCTGKV